LEYDLPFLVARFSPTRKAFGLVIVTVSCPPPQASRAESDETHRGRLSASWGCVTLFISPNLLTAADREEQAALLASWAKLIGEEQPRQTTAAIVNFIEKE
jgi:hypothetical protein